MLLPKCVNLIKLNSKYIEHVWIIHEIKYVIAIRSINGIFLEEGISIRILSLFYHQRKMPP